VFLDTPATGAWTVEVVATQVNVDGHVETVATDADYALVVTQ
jgi:serine protease AprX